MNEQPLYAQARSVDSKDDCFFYHFMDLPQEPTVGSTWDLRDCAEEYLGKLDYRGKRTLDVGTASGFLTFEMEKRGADVVSFDMPGVESWNFVPHYSLQGTWEDMKAIRSDTHRQMQNAYWYAHRQLNSKAKAHYGDVYNLPLELGNFDIVFMGMILPHLRDPFQALYSASRLASDTLIVTNPGGKPKFWDRLLGRKSSLAKFAPTADNNRCDVWWALTHSCIENMLGTIGFKVVDRISSTAVCNEDGQVTRRKNLAIVAKRVAGQAEGIATSESADRAHAAA